MDGFHHSLCHPCLSLILYTKAPWQLKFVLFMSLMRLLPIASM